MSKVDPKEFCDQYNINMGELYINGKLETIIIDSIVTINGNRVILDSIDNVNKVVGYTFCGEKYTAQFNQIQLVNVL